VFKIRLRVLLFCSLTVIGCATFHAPNENVGDAQERTEGRVIVLDNVPVKNEKGKWEKTNGVKIAENSVESFSSWACRDYSDGGRILIEPGFFNVPESISAGFVLFDGGDSGTFAIYQRQGINHRWDWGDDFSFIIKPDGTGLYYDFKGAKKSSKADDLFKCKPR